MNILWLISFFSLYFLQEVVSDTPESLEKGWGKEIQWTGLKDARTQSTKSKKPVMVMVTKSWCGACKALRPKFAESQTIAQLSKHFLMVHLEDVDDPEGEEFQVDGQYIPRIYFLGTDGKVMKDIINAKGKHVKDFKYYYGKAPQVANSMKNVLNKLDIKFEEVEESDGLSRGFGNDIDWMTYQEGLTEAKQSEKKLMLIIHKSWCGACKVLKPKLAKSEKFAELSKQFVMVNVEDKEEPSGSQFVVDGEYVPRIFFMDPSGQVIEKYWNEGTKYPHTKYYYSSAKQLTTAMTKVIDETKEEQKQEEKKKEEEQDEKDKKPWWMPKDGIDAKQVDTVDISNGFGSHITWHTYENGLELAKKSNKPIVLILHKKTCPSCTALKTAFSADKKLGEWSKKFVMVNMKASELPKDEQFKTDGDYVPKILFMDSNGKVMSDVWNEGTNYKHVKYYYQNGEELIKSMNRVLKKSKKPAKDHGWGSTFDWVDIDDAYDEAQQMNTPIMLIVHKSWCSACKVFKKKFAASDNLLQMSRKFTMVNVQDDDKKVEKLYDIDGAYVPRIYFIDPYTKKVLKDIYNHDPSYNVYKYAYGEAKQLLTSMKKAAAIELSKPTEQGGLGTDITWVPFNDALSQAKNTEKPVMLFIHRSWCQHSQALKSKIAASKDIATLGKDFVMVSLEDDEIPEKEYDIDGSYVPRIVFLDHKGEVQKKVTNPNTPVEDALYFYENVTDIVNSMRKVSPVHGLDRGYGKNIAWMTLTEGLKHSKESNKPTMVIIHKTWCGACKALKPHIANSTEIHELSKKFVMINLEDNEEPKDSTFDVDGLYYPRIFFIAPSGEVIKSVHNTNLVYLKFKYAYGDAETVLKSMQIALKKSNIQEEKKETKKESKTEAKQETKTDTKTTEETSTEEKIDMSGIDHGLGKDKDWVSLDQGYIAARKSWKPMMLVIHKSWCTACQAYIPNFAASKDIVKLSKNFIMVNVHDDFDHTDKRFDVDGAYLPRTFFLDPLGEVMKDIYNKDTPYPENKYYHYDAESVIRAMRKAKEVVKKMKKIEIRDEL